MSRLFSPLLRKAPSWGLLVLGLGLSSFALAQSPGSGAPPAASTPSFAPDPPPLAEAAQWRLIFRYQAGTVSLVDARPVRLAHPVTTPRKMGRYAVELLSGPTLVDRVRFNFPLIGADEGAGKPGSITDPPRFESKATVSVSVLVPDSSRVSRVRLVDRATGQMLSIAWPPRPGPQAPPDAGTDAAPDGDASDSAPEASHPDARPDAPPPPPPIPEAGLIDGPRLRDSSVRTPDAMPLEPRP